MNEIFFILFLLSGVIKTFIMYFHIPTGIDFTLSTALILTALLVKNLLNHKFVVRVNLVSKYAMILMFALFSLILFSLFYTSSEYYVYTKILQFFTIVLGFLFPLLIRNFSIEKFFKWFIIIVVTLTIVFLPLFISGYKSFSTQYLEYQNSPIAMIYQSYLTMGYLIAIALIINTFSPAFTGIRKTLISFFLFGVLLTTGARGPLFGFIIVILLFLLFKGSSIKKPKLSTFIGSIIVIGILSVYALPKHDISGLIERTFDRITTIRQDSSANDRIIRATFVLNHLDAEHLIFGYGFGSFGYEYLKVDTRSFPHNMPLEILFELGVLGLMIYLLLIVIIVKHLIGLRSFVLWALFLFLLLNSLKSLELTDSRVLFGFFAVILLYPSYQKSLKQDQIP